MSFSLSSYLEEKRKIVEQALEGYLQSNGKIPSNLLDAMRYSLFSGGKRLRPLLAICACELAGGRVELALPFACAIEMLHTYSLIHDDLPAMDNDDFRRGKPTCHKVFGEATAILAGDALHSQAFAVMSDAVAKLGIEPEVGIKVISELAKAIGPEGMAGGQSLDIEKKKASCSAEEIEEINLKKTASLFRACLRVGAMVAGADQETIERLSRFGELIGLAFQIVDDLIEDKEYEKKATSCAGYGLNSLRERARVLIEKAFEELKFFGESAKPLREIARFMVERED